MKGKGKFFALEECYLALWDVACANGCWFVWRACTLCSLVGGIDLISTLETAQRGDRGLRCIAKKCQSS